MLGGSRCLVEALRQIRHQGLQVGRVGRAGSGRVRGVGIELRHVLVVACFLLRLGPLRLRPLRLRPLRRRTIPSFRIALRIAGGRVGGVWMGVALREALNDTLCARRLEGEHHLSRVDLFSRRARLRQVRRHLPVIISCVCVRGAGKGTPSKAAGRKSIELGAEAAEQVGNPASDPSHHHHRAHRLGVQVNIHPHARPSSWRVRGSVRGSVAVGQRQQAWVGRVALHIVGAHQLPAEGRQQAVQVATVAAGYRSHGCIPKLAQARNLVAELILCLFGGMCAELGGARLGLCELAHHREQRRLRPVLQTPVAVIAIASAAHHACEHLLLLLATPLNGGKIGGEGDGEADSRGTRRLELHAHRGRREAHISEGVR